MPERRSQDGFTLIELMVVVLVIGVLVGAAVPTMLGARTRGQDGAAKSNLRASVEVAAGYATANAGTWPTATAMAADEASMTYVGSSTASTAPNIVSVEGGSGYVAAAMSASGTCWRVVQANGNTTFSTKTGTCRAAAEGAVSTFAGSGERAFADGTGTAAKFDSPIDLAADADGNLFVTDADNMRIRKITPAGVVTTYAGSGNFGSSDGPAASASFTVPMGIAVDAAGNVYVSDALARKIRKITPDGMVSTLAGSGANGFADGQGTAASFSTLGLLTIDSLGNLYVADTGNNAIRKITASGAVTTFAGSGASATVNGTGTAASFAEPFGVAADAADNIYVTEAAGHVVRKVTPAAVVTTFAGSGVKTTADGTGTAASFEVPSDIAFDVAGNLYVVDAEAMVIRKITPSAVVTTFSGSEINGFLDGAAGVARFSAPQGIVYSPLGDLYVADSINSRIRMIA